MFIPICMGRAKGLFYAFNCFNHCNGLNFATQSYFTAKLLKTDDKLTWKDTKYMLKFMYGRKGFMTRQIPELLDFLRPKFHPNDSDTTALLATWREN